MALIICPECGRQVSDKAEACPKCGYPISGINELSVETAKRRPSAEKEKKEIDDQAVNVNGYTMEELYPERFSESKTAAKDKTKNKGSRKTSSVSKQTAPVPQAVRYEKSQAKPRYTGTLYEYKPIATKHHILSKLAFIFIWIPGLCIVGLILAIIDLIRNKEYRHGLSYAAIIIFAGIYYVVFSLYRMEIIGIERENAAKNRTTVTETVDRKKDTAPKEEPEEDYEESLPYDYIFEQY